MNTTYNYHTFTNGMKLVHRQVASVVAYAGIYIGVGSRNEDATQEGMAHFIEHTIFKGTQHRQAHHILNRIDGVGGELNAFTTKEETCLYTTSLIAHLPRCLDLLSDLVFFATFPEKGLEKEKEVVIEEINSYKDSPADSIFDEFEELAFEGSPLAHNILGTKRQVSHFSPEAVRTFFRNNYHPERMVLSVVADIPFERLVRLCRRLFETTGGGTPTPARDDRHEAIVWRPFDIVKHQRTHQHHLLMGTPAPSLYDDDKVAFTLINNLLGGPAMNSRLNVAVREKQGYCYSIESQYSPFADTGIFYVYAGVDGDSVAQVRHIVCHELERLCHEPLSPRALRASQQQLIAQMAINNDSGLNEMQSIGKAYLTYGHVDTLEDTNREISEITSEQIIDVARKYFKPDRISVLEYQ